MGRGVSNANLKTRGSAWEDPKISRALVARRAYGPPRLWYPLFIYEPNSLNSRLVATVPPLQFVIMRMEPELMSRNATSIASS